MKILKHYEQQVLFTIDFYTSQPQCVKSSFFTAKTHLAHKQTTELVPACHRCPFQLEIIKAKVNGATKAEQVQPHISVVVVTHWIQFPKLKHLRYQGISH